MPSVPDLVAVILAVKLEADRLRLSERKSDAKVCSGSALDGMLPCGHAIVVCVCARVCACVRVCVCARSHRIRPMLEGKPVSLMLTYPTAIVAASPLFAATL
eukprot:164240-Pelagomonas_calceolata.AAC.1